MQYQKQTCQNYFSKTNSYDEQGENIELSIRYVATSQQLLQSQWCAYYR